MSGDPLVDAHDKGTLIGDVVIAKFFSDCVWIKIHLSHMPNESVEKLHNKIISSFSGVFLPSLITRSLLVRHSRRSKFHVSTAECRVLTYSTGSRQHQPERSDRLDCFCCAIFL